MDPEEEVFEAEDVALIFQFFFKQSYGSSKFLIIVSTNLHEIIVRSPN